MKIIAKKIAHRLIANTTVPASKLEVIYAVRTLDEERKLGQYKLVTGGIIKYFNNFKELRFYSDQVLYTKHKHIIIVKGEIPNDSC